MAFRTALRPLFSRLRHRPPRPFSWARAINPRAHQPAIVLEARALQASHRAMGSVKWLGGLGLTVMPATPAMEWGHQVCPGGSRELLPKGRQNRMPGIPAGRTEIRDNGGQSRPEASARSVGHSKKGIRHQGTIRQNPMPRQLPGPPRGSLLCFLLRQRPILGLASPLRRPRTDCRHSTVARIKGPPT